MSAPVRLKGISAYVITVLWWANDQMTKAVETMVTKVHDPKLKQTLTASSQGIVKHTAALKALLEEVDDEVEKEHCKGMEGLVAEALKHTVKEAPPEGDLLDILVVAQYQRMCHYGIAGFGSAAAYAEALGMKAHASKLKAMVAEIYKADEYASALGEKAAKAAPKED